MTQARSTQVSLTDTAYYHCISRCVRRAFLCGKDGYSGKSFEHRRLWLVERIHYLSDIFSVDVCAYAVMSNHYHLVLHVDVEQAEAWSHKEVATRWCQMHAGHPLVLSWLAGESGSEAETNAALTLIEVWRDRLMDISWFMRNLNEFIARQANKEDGCKGRFWEGRFKSQALLDEKALLACMAYVDLNPIRAKMVASVEDSEFTSAYERIHNKVCSDESAVNLSDVHLTNNSSLGLNNAGVKSTKALLGFIGNETDAQPKGIAFSLLDYLELLDWTGRVIHPYKRGAITSNRPKLLYQLGFSDQKWLAMASRIGGRDHCAVGTLSELVQYAHNTGRCWISGQKSISL
ncbi:transposase [Shewanella sp. NR704-98]|uniref:Transposase n=2 Tax=Shewanella nanhaiensis TaxID=2864872 RepID=A0ABS7E6B9_9GAMM|nr:transposase [Shewanella nanhaiensis]